MVEEGLLCHGEYWIGCQLEERVGPDVPGTVVTVLPSELESIPNPTASMMPAAS
jgi:hypothetical protein